MTPTAAGLEATTAEVTIEDVDFLNGFSYSGALFDPVVVNDGVGANGILGDPRFINIQVIDVVYGDLDGDLRNEAAVTTSTNTGTAGRVVATGIYAIRDGVPELVGVVPGGDRGNGGVYNAYFADGGLMVETMAAAVMSCCPETVNTTRWEMVDNLFAAVQQFPERTFFWLDENPRDVVLRPETSPAVLAVSYYETQVRFRFDATAGHLFELEPVAWYSPSCITVTDSATGAIVAAAVTEITIEIPAAGTYDVAVTFDAGEPSRSSLVASLDRLDSSDSSAISDPDAIDNCD